MDSNPITKCIFPSAGLGTRFLPITKALPKELLPIINKPLLQFAVEEAFTAGISDMVVIINENKLAIKRYFTASNDSYNKKQQLLLNQLALLMSSCQFHFPYQPQALGLGHAITCAQKEIDQDDFAVALPDDFCCSNPLSRMISLYRKYDCSVIAVEKVSKKDIHLYGIVDIDEEPLEEGVFRIKTMLEKPKPQEAPSNLGVVGRYILKNDIFSVLNSLPTSINGEIQLTDALKQQALKGEAIAYMLPSQRYDCGTAEGFIKAINVYRTRLGL